MFAKNDPNAFDKFLSHAKKIANQLNDLERKSVEEAERIDTEVDSDLAKAGEQIKQRYIAEVLGSVNQFLNY